MNPNTLRNRVERAILSLIEPTAWERCKIVEHAERDSLATVLRAWKT